jgi:hypothetical protein
MAKKRANPEEKLRWLRNQKDYWYERTRGEFSAEAKLKFGYYAAKVRYWEVRIASCEDPTKPSNEERDRIAQQML